MVLAVLGSDWPYSVFSPAGADAAGFLFHFFQHTVQLLQRKNLMVFQIIGGVDKGL